MEASNLGEEMCTGSLTKLSRKGAEAHLANPVPDFSNLKMRLIGSEGQEIPATLYGKIVGTVGGSSTHFSIRFTSVPPEIEIFLRGLTATTACAD
jgi:hypothetical protein